MLVRQKLCHNITNIQGLSEMFTFVLRIFWHQFDMSTMCRSPQVINYVFHNFGDFDLQSIIVNFSTMQIKNTNTATSI